MENGGYIIRQAKARDKVWGITAGSRAEGAEIILWDATGQSNQTFQVEEVGNNQYTIKANHTGNYIYANLRDHKLAKGEYGNGVWIEPNTNRLNDGSQSIILEKVW